MDHLQFVSSRNGPQRVPIYQPKPRIQLVPPTVRPYSDLHPSTGNRMYLPSASTMALPSPFLNDFSASFPVNPGSPYGMLWPPSRLPSGCSYPPSVDFGYGFPGRVPLPPLSHHNAFLSPRQLDDAVWQAQYQARMNALQNQLNSFVKSLQTTNTPNKGRPMFTKSGALLVPEGTAPNGAEAAPGLGAEPSGKSRSTSGDVSRLPALPKLHTRGRHEVASPTRHGGLNPPPLHLAAVKQPLNLSHPPLTPASNDCHPDSGEKHKNSEDKEICTARMPSDGITEDISTVWCAAAKLPKLPPLIIGNKDLARKLTAEGENQTLSLKSAAKNLISLDFREEQSCYVAGQPDRDSADGRGLIMDADEGSPSRLLHTDGNWMQDMMSSFRNGQSLVSHHPSYPSHGLSDIEAMQQAYIELTTYKDDSQGHSAVSSKGLNGNETASTPPDSNSSRSIGNRRCHVSPSGVRHSTPYAPPSFPFQFPFHRDLLEKFAPPKDLTLSSSTNVSNLSMGSRPGESNALLLSCDSLVVSSNASTEVVSDIVNVKQEVVDDDGRNVNAHSYNVQRSFNVQDDDGAVDLVLPSVRRMAETSDNQLPCNSEGSWLPDGEADQSDTLVRDRPHVPLGSSRDLSFQDLEQCNSIAARPQLHAVERQQLSVLPGLATNDAGEDRSGEFRCHLCNYSGRSQHCLNKHFRAHSQACKICRYCLKAFERPSDLVRHEERHQKRNHVLMGSIDSRPPQSSQLGPDKAAKKRRSWTCRLCDFTCHEARKLITHTRKMHPISFECSLCHLKFPSEAELSEHKLHCHPIALGRIDTYKSGVVTATKLVSCLLTGDQEISVDLADVSELPSDCVGIPEVSNLHELKCILGKNTSSSLGTAEPPENSQEDQFCRDVAKLTDCAQVLDLRSPFVSTTLNDDTTASLPCVQTEAETPVENILAHGVDGVAEGEQLQSCAAENVTQILDNFLQQGDAIDSAEISPASNSEQTAQLDLKHLKMAKVCDQNLSALNGPQVPDVNESVSSDKSQNTDQQKPSLLTKIPLGSKKRRQKYSVCLQDDASPSDIKIVKIRIKNVSGIVKAEKLETVSSEKAKTKTAEKQGNCDKVNVIASTDAILKTEISQPERTVRNSGESTESSDGLDVKGSTYVCVRCKYSTNAKFKYQQHLKAHNGRFICKRCNKACLKSSDLYRHWVTHNVKGPDGYFACDTCSFTSPQKYVIEDHMKQHYTLRPEQSQRQLSLMSRCGICQKNVLRSRLFEHKRTVHGKFFLKPRINETSGKIETDANGNSIKVSPKTFTCPQCDRKFTTPSYLLRHHFLHHQQSPKTGGWTVADDSVCCCRFCGIKFEDVDCLQDHELNHILQTCSDVGYVNRTRKRKRKSAEAVVDTKPASPMKFDILESQKRNPNRRKLSCSHCRKPFKLQYFLDQHMRIHGDERPFVCQWCGAGFAIYQNLNTHRRYKCPNRKTLAPVETTSGCKKDDDESGVTIAKIETVIG